MATYYINTTGTDGAAVNGDETHPWKTLSYACTRATTPGDVIYVVAGTYIETTVSSLAVGVNIIGEGETSIIKSNFTGNTVELTSASYNTNGNQTISYLKFDGNSFTGDFAIYVTKRGNVKIHHCTFVDYDWTAIYFKGDASSKTTIAEFSYDNEAYDNTITNCSNYDTGPGKGIELYDQGGSLVYNNIITQTGRALGSNGGGIGINGGVNIKIHDNIITCDPAVDDDDAHPYNFAIEMWDMNGGIEIYDNECYNGAIDIAGNFSRKGDYNYSVSLHDNFIGRTALTSLSRVGIYLEAISDLSDVLIYNNHIKYVQRGIHLATYASKTYNNVSIYYNIFDNIGKDVDGYNGWGIYCPCLNAFTATNWRIDNNTFVYETERAGDIGMGAIRIPNCTSSTITYWYIRNNTIVNFSYSPIYAGNTGTIDYLWIENNCMYNNGNSNDPMLLITPTHYTNSDNIKSNPLFIGSNSYKLQSTSPCIDVGIDVSLYKDYAGTTVPFSTSPDIGAYEYTYTDISGTSYYVSNDGSDNYAGLTTITPWQSITKVNASMGKLSPGDGILFNRGDTFYGTITVSKSGTAGNPITFGAYGSGNKPIITGFTDVSNWIQYDSSRFYATVTSEASTNMVLVDGSQYAVGRYPKAGTYLKYENHVSTTKISDNSINSAIINWTGAEVAIYKNDWSLCRCLITNHDVSSLTYSVLFYDTQEPEDNRPYFIQNDLRCATEMNEWYHAKGANTFYICSSPSEKTVQVATLNYLFYNYGYDYITIDNIEFTGSISHAVYFYNNYSNNTNGVTIKNCNISYAGEMGIQVFSSGSPGLIDNNTISHCNADGIFCLQLDTSITNNSISYIDMIIGQNHVTSSHGIYHQGTGCIIQYNHIEYTGYDGIMLSTDSGVTCKNNFVNYPMQILDDGGGIYFGGQYTLTRTIEGNIFLNSGIGNTFNNPTLCEGIYVDSNAKNILVKNNTCAYNLYSGIKVHVSDTIQLQNNLCFDNGVTGIYIQQSTDTQSYNISLSENKFIAKDSNDYVARISSVANDISTFFTLSDYNYYARPLDDDYTIYTYDPVHGSVSRTLDSTNSWQTFSGQDANSKKSSITVDSSDDILFYYNASIGVYKTIELPLGYYYKDVSGTSYSGTIDLSSFTSIVLLLDSSVRAYYVKNNGSDNYSGLSDASACEHHPWMLGWTGTTTLVPGDTIYMNRGDTWTIASPATHFITVDQDGAEGLPITTTAYGTGDKPIINISTDTNKSVIFGWGKSYITLDNLNITHCSSIFSETGYYKNGIYFGTDESGNKSHDWTITNCDVHECPYCGIQNYRDAYNVIIGDVSTTYTATDASYSNQVYNCGYGAIMLWGRDPSTDISNFKVYFNYIHDIDVPFNYMNSYGIALSSRGVTTDSGWPNYCYVCYNYVANIPNWEGLDCHAGSYIYMQDNYIYNTNDGIMCSAANKAGYETGRLDHCYIERNIVENPSTHSGDKNITFITLYGTTTSLRPIDCAIRDNVCFYTTRPYDSSQHLGIRNYQSERLIIEGNYIYNGPINPTYGYALRVGDTFATSCVKDVVIRNNFIKDWPYGIYLPPAFDGDVSIYNNIVDVSIIAMYITGDPSTTISVYNNVFLTITSGSYAPFHYQTAQILTNGVLSIKNNIIGYKNPTDYYYFKTTQTDISGNVYIDNNLYWNSTRSNPFYVVTSATSLANWKALGYDTHSPNNIVDLDPLFTNESGTYILDTDYKLQADSSAISAGTYLNLTTDYDGSIWNNPPSIGAYEYSETYTPTSAPTVTTTPITDISTRTATSGGNVIHDGSISLTYRGLCWGTSENPSVTDTSVLDIDTGEGTYTSYLTSLNASTHYHVRAFAYNSVGISYGIDVSFNTLSFGTSSLLNGLTAYWKLNEVYGSTTVNEIYNSYDLSVYGSPNLGVVAKIDTGIECSTNTQYLYNSSIGKYICPDDSSQFSVSLWLKLNVLPSARGTAHMYAFYLERDVVGGDNLKVTIPYSGGAADAIYFGTYDASSTATYSISSDLSTNIWYNVVCIANPGEALKIYINGAYNVTSSRRTQPDTIQPARKIYVASHPSYPMDGIVDEIAIWNRALTTTEVSTLYNEGDGLSYPFNISETIPTVSTSAITNIDTNNASCGGNVTNNGGSTVIAKGICWTTGTNPTVTDSSTIDGLGEGIFGSALSYLDSSTVYNIRAYAYNSLGIAYGDNVSFSTTSHGGSTLRDGLMGYWKLNETSGSALDSYRNYNGTVYGATQGISGKISKAYSFDSTDYVSFGNVCKPTTGISISMWINVSTYNTWATILGNTYRIGSQYYGYDVFTKGDSDKINFALYSETGSIQYNSSTSITEDGLWHFVICSWDGSAMNIYIDNSSGEGNVPKTSVISYTADSSLMFGAQYGTNKYKGSLDEVGIWNRALTADERSTLYNSGAGLTYPFTEEPVTRSYAYRSGNTVLTLNGKMLIFTTES